MPLPISRRALPVIAALGLAACGGGDDVSSDAERFCGEAKANRALIIAPPITTEAELAATLEFYELMARLAPISIAEEWNDLVVSLRTASTVVPGDRESEQLVAMTAYATERSAYEVSEWLADNCGVDIPITTIAPQEPAAGFPTTVPGSSVPATTDDG